MRILFRTSGGKAPGLELGLGHIYRCINLAENLKKNDLFFLIEDYGKIVNKILKKNGHNKFFILRNNIDVKSDIKKTLQIIKKFKIDIVIIDKYNLKNEYIKSIKKVVKTVVITDLYQNKISADLLINGFIGFKNQKTINRYGTKCLLGPRYQIINDEFSKQVSPTKKYTLLITFGGFDENKLIELILEPLSWFLDKIKTKIILGPATPKSKKIRKFESNFQNKLTIISKTNSMSKEISNSEYGLCSGGITTYEFAAKRRFFGIICKVKYQEITAKKWHEEKIAITLGLKDSINHKKVWKFLENISKRKYPKKTRGIIDGKGSQRVAIEILKIKTINR